MTDMSHPPRLSPQGILRSSVLVPNNQIFVPRSVNQKVFS